MPDFTHLSRLDGRKFLVLGAGRGIGRHAAHALAAHGARVVCVDNEKDRATAVATEVDGHAVPADIRDRGSLERAFAVQDQLPGKFGGVVDVVGMAYWAGIRDITDELWDDSFEMNLKHALLTMQLADKAVTTQTASLVFVASISGLGSAPMHAPYGAAKAGLLSMVRSGAVELAPRLRVNAVAPGKTLTPRILEKGDVDAARRAEEITPLGRLAGSADIAAALLFFASDLSSHVTGQTLVVDGGVGRRFAYEV